MTILKIHNKEENILWNRLRQRDIVALGELYDLYIDVLLSFGIQASEDKEYVMDCIHDLFLDLYKYGRKIGPTDNIKRYLLKSLKRKLNRKYKTKTVSVSNEYAFENSSYSLNKYAESFEEEIIASESAIEKNIRLKNALNFLTKRQKKGLFLRFNEEKAYEEIAEIMDVSIQTSRTIVYRGIKTLRQYLVLVFTFITSTFFC
ncbi:MAG: sigma-70 family RNA polymerase sigma factor [Flavobacteriaceae bacterium]